MLSTYDATEFENTQPRRERDTYRVGIAEGALISSNENIQYVMTEGLRTCVAFALTSPDDNLALLVHFSCLNQVARNLDKMVLSFMQSRTAHTAIHCAIVGGRVGTYQSEKIVETIETYVFKKFPRYDGILKAKVHGPVCGDYAQTLSYQINLSTGEDKILMSNTGDTDRISPITITDFDHTNEIATDSIAFTILTSP